jgi:FtsP/CotA-like multicopper oxidase with cupredoxin domain
MRFQTFCRRRVTAAVAAALLWTTPDSHAAGPDGLQPQGWSTNLKLPEAVDMSPDPHILEINLDARVAQVEYAPGHRVDMWTYNGGLPGPLIRLSVGDRLIVHFTNRLPQPTTVHWHGLRVPIQMDGVPNISQAEVKTGESFTYDFVVPDAGLYWYHPHVASAAQVGFGLYGALLVDDPNERIGVADELVMVLSDLAINETGGLEAPDSGGPAGMVFGREGSHVLINGRTTPTLTVRAGVPQRWRIVNAAKSRFFTLSLDGQPFTIIGGDGGLQEYPVKADTVVVATGERVDLIVTPEGAPKSELVFRSLLFNRGYGSVEYRDNEDLINLRIADLPRVESPPLPEIGRKIAPIDRAGAVPVTITLTLAKTRDGGFEYGIDGVPFAKDKPLLAKLNETHVWTIVNTTKWSHPFHLHGFFFQQLGENLEPVHPIAWKDTLNVPLEDSIRVIVKFDERAGSWMYHCHILDHADGGLMGWVELGSPPKSLHPHHAAP